MVEIGEAMRLVAHYLRDREMKREDGQVYLEEIGS